MWILSDYGPWLQISAGMQLWFVCLFVCLFTSPLLNYAELECETKFPIYVISCMYARSFKKVSKHILGATP